MDSKASNYCIHYMWYHPRDPVFSPVTPINLHAIETGYSCKSIRHRVRLRAMT